MISISLCMIVKNEEACLSNCLHSVRELVDEWIIVDTGSTDSTEQIIRQYTDTVYHFAWCNDFSAARNYAFSLATKEYILWLDADDVLLEADQLRFKELKETLSSNIDIVTMIYDITFNKKGECTLSIPKKKLVKNHKGFHWKYFVHEELITSGTSFSSNIHITHTSDHGHYPRYLSNYEQRLADGFVLLPHEQYFYGGELFMAHKYEECISALETFLLHPSENIFEISHAYDFLASSYEHTNQLDVAIFSKLHSFATELPTVYSCYYIGQLFYKKKEYSLALFWFHQTLELPSLFPSLSPNVYEKQLSLYLYLCVCYYHTGDLETACRYNEKALAIDPNNLEALNNKKFFTS